MFNKILSVFVAFMFMASTSVLAEVITLDTKTPPESQKRVVTVPLDSYKKVSSLDLVMLPSKYMNKNVKINAKFDKFSAIGLDYPPINRDAKDYISILIKRENVTDYNIPLSELKLIMKRDVAEKELVNLEQGDDIEIYGNVFSMALGDPWVDVVKVNILTIHEKKEEVKK